MKAERLPAEVKSRPKLVFLFVDDPEEAELHGQLLERFGYRVRVARNPTSVSGGALKLRPAAQVINNTQPRHLETSLAALRRLHESGRLTCPTVLVGDRADLRLRLAALRGGCRSFLGRPVDPIVLVETIDRLTLPRGGEPLRVLIVDDSALTSKLHASFLQEAGMATRIVNDPMAVDGPLHDFHPELILMDLEMPGCSGRELAAVIRQEQAFDGIPIVFLSGEGDIDRQLAAMSGGGDDFLVKPIQPSHLIQAVAIKAQRFRRLARQLICDPLTQTLNEPTMRRRIHALAETARDAAAPFSLVIIEIDAFDRLNERYGRPAADLMLKSLARLLKQWLDRDHLVGRLDGSGLAVAFPGESPDHAQRLVERIRCEFESIAHAAEGEQFHLTLSAGVAGSAPALTAAEQIRAARRALHRARRSPGNRVATAPPRRATRSRPRA